MTDSDNIPVIIADDHPLFRRGLRDIIADSDRFTVIAECGDGDDAIAKCALLRPRAAVLDVEMPRRSGLETAEALAALPAPPAVLFLSMHDTRDVVQRAMSTGALGFILKDDAEKEIITALEHVVRGQKYLSAALEQRLQTSAPRHEPDPGSELSLALLSPAERRVLRMIAENRSTREIGDALGISTHTVNGHRYHITQKLGLNGAYALVRYALMHRESL